MASFDDDDVDFSGPTHGLAAVPFGSSSRSQSISSTTQQQQQTQQSNGAAQAAAALLSQAKPMTAAAVDAFKFVGDQYQPQGKVGMSLLGVAASRQYLIIMYRQAKGEKVPLTVTPVGEKFKFIARSDNYASFYDDTGCNWAARFDSVESLASFCLQVAVARALSNPKQQIVLQDVVVGPENGSETVGDGWKVECNYTVYNLASNGTSVPVQSQTLQKQRLKASANKAGLSQILVGMTFPGGRRIGLHLQPDGNFLVYDITVLRAKGPSAQTAVSGDNTSISELESSQGASSGSGRGGILSRMARLGQHVLPGPEVVQTEEQQQGEYSDSESVSVPTASPSKQRRPVKGAEPPFVPARTHVNTNAAPTAASVPTNPGVAMIVGQTGVPIPTLIPQNALATRQQIAVYQSPLYAAQQPQLIQQPDMTSPLPQQGEAQRPEWSVLFMETRQNSTEMRVVLSRLQDKIDAISQRLDQQQQLQMHSAASLEVAGGVLDGRAVMSALQRMVAEEERLREELKARQDKIEQLNLRVSELITDKQCLIEQSNRALSDRSDALSTTTAQSAGRVLHLEEEKANLAIRVSTLTAEVSDLHLAVAEKRRSELELRNELIAMKETVAQTTKSMEESAQAVRHMEAQFASAKDAESLANGELTTEKRRVGVLQNELAEIKKQLETTRSALSAKDASLMDTLSKASEEQTAFSTRARSLEDEISRLEQDVHTSRANAERLSDQLRVKMAENQELASDRDRINNELRQKVGEISKFGLQIAELNRSLEDSKQEKSSLRSQMSSMRETYDARLADLEARVLEEQERYRSLVASVPTPESIDATIAQQVKTIMNNVYQSTRGSISGDGEYYGNEVMKTLLAVIKQTTLSFLNKASGPVTVPPAKTIQREPPKIEPVSPSVVSEVPVSPPRIEKREPEMSTFSPFSPPKEVSFSPSPPKKEAAFSPPSPPKEEAFSPPRKEPEIEAISPPSPPKEDNFSPSPPKKEAVFSSPAVSPKEAAFSPPKEEAFSSSPAKKEPEIEDISPPSPPTKEEPKEDHPLVQNEKEVSPKSPVKVPEVNNSSWLYESSSSENGDDIVTQGQVEPPVSSSPEKPLEQTDGIVEAVNEEEPKQEENGEKDVPDEFPSGIAPVYVTPEGAPESVIVPVHRDLVVPEDSPGRTDNFLDEPEQHVELNTEKLGENSSQPPAVVTENSADPLGVTLLKEEENEPPAVELADPLQSPEKIPEPVPAEKVEEHFEEEQAPEETTEEQISNSDQAPAEEVPASEKLEESVPDEVVVVDPLSAEIVPEKPVVEEIKVSSSPQKDEEIENETETEKEKETEENVDPLGLIGSQLSPPEPQQVETPLVEKVDEDKRSPSKSLSKEEIQTPLGTPAQNNPVEKVEEPGKVEEPTKRKESLFGDDLDSDTEDLFGAKPPPTPAVHPPVTKTPSGTEKSLFEQSKVQDQENEREEEEEEASKVKQPPVPATRGGALFSDDDEDGDDWFSSK